MKEMSTFTKLFSGAVIWTICFFGIAAYSSQKAKEQDPEIMKKVEANLSEKFKGNVQFSVGGSSGEDSIETFTTPLPKSAIQIKSVSGDFAIQYGSGKEIVVKATGTLDKSKAEKLLIIDQNDETLSISEPEDAVNNLAVEIYLPLQFQNEIEIKVVSGDIEVKGLTLSGLAIKTVSGDIKAHEVKAKTIDVKTISGDISIDNKGPVDVNAATISGDIALTLPSTVENTNFRLKSISGDIQNARVSTGKALFSVDMKTTSGDIKVQ